MTIYSIIILVSGILFVLTAFIIETGKWRRDKGFYTLKQKVIRSLNFAMLESILLLFLFDNSIQRILTFYGKAVYLLLICILIMLILCLVCWDYKLLRDKTRGKK